MKGFLGGFVVASLLWGGAFYAYDAGLLSAQPEEVAAAAPEEVEAEEETSSMRRRRRRRERKRGKRSGMDRDDRPRMQRGGVGESGDDLGEVTRQLDLGSAGGEAQLNASQIDNVVERAFPRIRRCLLVAEGDDITGRLRVGLRIAGTGRVSRVNLRGPRAVSQGECGDCIRTAVRGLRFPSFDGPDQLTSFPITLE